MLYLRAHWDEIPARYPVHFDINGVPNRWVERAERAVFAPLRRDAAAVAAAGGGGADRVAQERPAHGAPGHFCGGDVRGELQFHRDGADAPGTMPTGVMVGLTMAFVLAMLVWAYRSNSDPDTPMEETPDECWTLGGDLQESQRSGDICAEAGWVRLHDQLGNVWSYVVLGGFTLGAIGLAAWLT